MSSQTNTEWKKIEKLETWQLQQNLKCTYQQLLDQITKNHPQSKLIFQNRNGINGNDFKFKYDEFLNENNHKRMEKLMSKQIVNDNSSKQYQIVESKKLGNYFSALNKRKMISANCQQQSPSNMWKSKLRMTKNNTKNSIHHQRLAKARRLGNLYATINSSGFSNKTKNHLSKPKKPNAVSNHKNGDK